MFNRSMMKQSAKDKLMKPRSGFLGASLVYTALTFVIFQLVARLSGYATYVSSYYSVMLNSASTKADFSSVLWPAVPPAAYILSGVLMLLNVALATGFKWYCLRLSRRISSKIKNLFDFFEYFLSVILLSLLKSLLIALAGCLLLVPGLILYYRYSFAEYVLFDHPEYSVVQCLRESARLTKGRKWELLVLDLSFLGWYIMRYLTDNILGVWVTPYEYGTKCEYYNLLSGWTPAAASSPEGPWNPGDQGGQQ